VTAALVTLYDAGGFWFVAFVVEAVIASVLVLLVAAPVVAAGAWTWLQANLGDE
jgi:hypothetical protein